MPVFSKPWSVRVPKPSYLRSQLLPRGEPDGIEQSALARLAELYQLGEIKACHRAPRSRSANYIVTTAQGKYVFRRHALSKETIAHEHQVLNYLERRQFAAPRMCQDREGRAWAQIDEAIYGVYEYVDGYCFTDFIWRPAKRQEILRLAGRTLAEYHRAIAGLVPTRYKWDGYRPTEHIRWRDGDLYRQALAEIRPLLHRANATDPVDEFARSRIKAIERLLDLESAVEGCCGLTKLVIHGDYAPWNILVRPDQSLFVLDFNAARLDLKVFDVLLATFWFAWRNDRLDLDRAMGFQTGYCQAGSLSETEIAHASKVFQWVMGRSLAERLRTRYLDQRSVIKDPANLERNFQMCVWAAQHPRQLTGGLKNTAQSSEDVR